MEPPFTLGDRFSIDGNRCTLRYVGPLVGHLGDWYGVEWDDSSRGKHAGSIGDQFYFQCQSQSMTAASFIRPSRQMDSSQDFVSAVRQKYVSGPSDGIDCSVKRREHLKISGKFVEEIGFDKIRSQLSELQGLKIVIVDGLRIRGSTIEDTTIESVCSGIVELDLSRNLLKKWLEVSQICMSLKHLKSLRLNGNRFKDGPVFSKMSKISNAFTTVVELGLDETLINWAEVVEVLKLFPALLNLSISDNELTRIPLLPPTSTCLTSISLEYNSFTCLSDLVGLTACLALRKIYLKGNLIRDISHHPSVSADTYGSVNSTFETSIKAETRGMVVVFGMQLIYVDLSHNNVHEWSFVDELPKVFPGLTSLRISHNPFYESNSTGGAKKIASTSSAVDESFMLTIARIASLQALNFSTVSSADRINAELFYLSRVREALKIQDEHAVVRRHPRFKELCKLYGGDELGRSNLEKSPNWLETRLIKFTFSMAAGTCVGQKDPVVKVLEFPKTFDVYQIKGLAASHFGIAPLSLQLVWETEELDWVATHHEGVDTPVTNDGEADPSRVRGKLSKREVVLIDSTRQVGNTIHTRSANVRVELRSLVV